MPTRENSITLPVLAPLARQARSNYGGPCQFKEGVLCDFDDVSLQRHVHET